MRHAPHARPPHPHNGATPNPPTRQRHNRPTPLPPCQAFMPSFGFLFPRLAVVMAIRRTLPASLPWLPLCRGLLCLLLSAGIFAASPRPACPPSAIGMNGARQHRGKRPRQPAPMRRPRRSLAQVAPVGRSRSRKNSHIAPVGRPRRLEIGLRKNPPTPRKNAPSGRLWPSVTSTAHVAPVGRVNRSPRSPTSVGSIGRANCTHRPRRSRESVAQ